MEQRGPGYQSTTAVYLPSNPSHGRRMRHMRARLWFRWTVTVANRGSGTTNPNQYRMHRARLHLTTAHDRLRSTARFSTASAFRALVHVQLTWLHRATTASCGTATPGTLYASPNPLHSTTGVRLTTVRPTPHGALDSPRRPSDRLGWFRHPAALRQTLHPEFRLNELREQTNLAGDVLAAH